ncbi:MAG: hypothetical protein V4760_03430 [Bdellovibrionota bacterium]
MKSHRILVLLSLVMSLAACSKGGSSDVLSVKGENVLTYQIATADPVTGGVQIDDLAYVDFDKSRLIVADFNVCFRVVPLTAGDLEALREAILYANAGQSQAQAACASSTDSYKVTSLQLTSDLAVCGTALKDMLDEIMSRPATRLCKAL